MLPKTISIIGSGNLTWHLVQWLNNSSFKVLEIVKGNTPTNNSDFDFTGQNIVFKSRVEQLSRDSDIYMICTPDDVIESVVLQWPFELSDKQILLHCSGLKSSLILEKAARQFGVFWPVQTLIKNVPNLCPPSIIYTAHTSYVSNVLSKMASTCTSSYEKRSDEEREKIHLAAVVVNNFCHHLLALAKEFCHHHQLDFAILQPILTETVHKALSDTSGKNIQTGPAVRNDVRTMERHIQILRDDILLKDLYQKISQSIQQKNNIL